MIVTWGLRPPETVANSRPSPPGTDPRTHASGRSSGVEHDLAKVGVEGSNPFARSIITKKPPSGYALGGASPRRSAETPSDSPHTCIIRGIHQKFATAVNLAEPITGRAFPTGPAHPRHLAFVGNDLLLAESSRILCRNPLTWRDRDRGGPRDRSAHASRFFDLVDRAARRQHPRRVAPL